MKNETNASDGQMRGQLEMTRRAFMGVTAGAAALATGAFADKAAAEEAAEGIRILPASPLAQSSLLMFAPEMLAGLVEPIPEAELPGGDASYNDLPLVGGFNAFSPQRYEKALREIRPDRVIDARIYSEDHWDALKELSSEFPEIDVVPLDVSGLSAFGAVRAVMAQVPKQADPHRLEALEWLESELAAAVKAVSSDSKPPVHMGEDSRSVKGLGGLSAERLMFAEAGADPWLPKTEDSMYDGDGPEVVVVSSQAAWEGYLTKNYDQFCWSLTDAAACGDVLPGLAFGTQWVQDMSGFAKASVGAFWLGGLLHPAEFGDSPQAAAERYYAVLCDNPSAIGAIEDAGLSKVQEAFAGKSRMRRLECQHERAAARAESAERAFARVGEEANRERGAEELEDVFDSFVSALGLKPDEGAKARFIEAMQESYGKR